MVGLWTGKCCICAFKGADHYEISTFESAQNYKKCTFEGAYIKE